MDAITLITLASITCWSAIGTYLFLLCKKQTKLTKKMQQIVSLENKDE